MSSPSSPEREPAELLQQLQHAFASLYAAQTPADVLDALARLLPPGFASAELLLADRAAPDTLALAATWTPAGAQLAREARALRDYPPSSAGVLAIADVAADPSLSETARAWLIRKGIGALVLMPMSTGQAPAGLVMFTAPVPVDVSAERVQVLRVLSDLAAMALQSQRVLQSTAERDSGQVDLPRLLNQISTRLAQFTEQAALLDYVTEELSRLADIDHVGIVLLEPDGVYGRVISEYPPSAALGSLLNMQENPLLKMALRDPDRPLIVEDAQRSDLLPDETKALFARMGVQDMMIVPLVVGGELIGSMGLDIYSPDKHFSEDTVEIGRLIGTQMAISLQNIRLVTGERQRAERLARQVTLLQVLSQTSNRLAQFTEQAALLDYVTEELSRLADIDHVGIVLLEPDGVYGRVISEYPPSAALGSLLNMQENPLLKMALRDPDRPLIVEDAQRSDLLPDETKALFARMGVQEMMIVPLVVAGELIGSMGLDIYSHDKHFSEDAVEIGRLIGTQMAISLQNIRLVTGERQRAERLTRQVTLLQVLSQTSNRLAQFTEQAALLDYVTEELSRLADIDHVGIVLLEPDGVYGRVISEYPPSAALGSLLNMQENPLLTMALRDPDHPLIVEDAQHSALLPAETKALFTTMGVQDLMIVPLVVAGELIGSMGLDIYSPDKHFSEDAVEIGRLIGTQMVTSLQNIRLLSSERQRAEELAQIARNEMLLSQIGARYQQVQSVDDLLQVTLEELGAALGAERASIRMSAGDAPLLEAGR